MASTAKSKSLPADPRKDNYSFTLILTGSEAITDGLEDALFNAGCNDALLGLCERQLFLDFDREAHSLTEAIRSAIEDVERSGLGIKVQRVVPPGDREIALFNALLRLRNDTPNFPEIKPD